MAVMHRCGLAALLILTLINTQYANAQDAKAGRELFEREWEFVDRARTADAFDSMRRMPQRRDRGHGQRIGRGPRSESRDNGQALASIRPSDGLELQSDGLGPLYNAVSCAACHPGGGASGVDHNVTWITIDPRSPYFDPPTDRRGRGAPRSSVMDLFPALVSGNTLSSGTVVHDRSTRPGYDTLRQRLSVGVVNGLQPQWFSPQERTIDAIARQPVVAGRYGTLDYYLSQRNSPPLYGMGEIERISINRLKAISLSQQRSSAGRISGRVAGKYGWRGQINTLADFVAAACATELGLNVAGAAQQADDPADPHYQSFAADISTTQLADLTSYVADLPAPSKPLLSLDERKRVRRGKLVFNSIGCAACHIADLPPARDIFSDLLLHDMGAELQDPFPAAAQQLTSMNAAAPYQNRYGGGETSAYGNAAALNRTGYPSSRSGGRGTQGRSAPRVVSSYDPAEAPRAIAMDYPPQPQFPRGEVDEADIQGRHRFSWDVLQREWKTPPLWGVADSAPYLHDGRAATLTEAIQWHGGEAEASKQAFIKLKEEQRELLLTFLKSLKSPIN
ncbi:di-heme oxidoredictase family protein [Novipirellula maiorica]|nr:di-heme oxidoredictase family protein [Rhodopirellula maiorica]